MTQNTIQIPLDLKNPVSFDLADFITSSSNHDAVRFLQNWQQWPLHFVAVSGPRACGKSHLLHGWASQNGAKIISHETDISSLKPAGLYALDDVNKRNDNGEFAISDVDLFHLFNWVREINASILVTAENAPSQWQRTLPDLKSRLGIVPVVSIEEADDELLIQLLLKLFSDRQLSVDMNVVHYILKHMERSFSSARTLVDLVDKSALGTRRKISKQLVKECLQ